MANEAVNVLEYSLPINFTCADGTGIEQGTILKMTSPMTAAAAGDDDVIAGICHTEKVANDGTTSVSVYRDGIFRVLAGAGVTTGQLLKTNATTGADNEVIPVAAGANSTENVVGIALEDANDTDSFLMELKPSQLSWPA